MLYRLQKLFAIIFTASLVLSANGQGGTYTTFVGIDDLTLKAEVAVELWNVYLRNDPDSLKIVAHDLLESSIEENHHFAKAIGEFCLSSYLIRKGDFERGIHYMNDAISFFGNQENYELLSIAYNELGHAYFLQGKYNDAVKMYSNSLSHGKLSPDPTSEFNAKIGMGKSFCALGDTIEGLNYLTQYKNESLKRLKFESVADVYAYMGEVELERNPTLAKSHFEKSIKFSIRSNSKAHLSHSYNNQAIVFFSLGNLDSSLFYFKRSLDIRLAMGHMKGISESYNNLGFYYQELEDYKNARLYYLKCVEHCRLNHFIQDELDALVELRTINSLLNYKEYSAELEERIKHLEDLIQTESGKSLNEIGELEILAGTKLESDLEKDSSMLLGILSIVIAGVLLLVLFIAKKRESD